ncbi:MAG: two-component system, NarL family, nitrate/nitrite response regulator NarL [Thermoleophilaceae bacterium]|nr:two-component system, NarL family, nitrate/nitrite response regulator NarL [Thermoleophilaceae bacterium]
MDDAEGLHITDETEPVRVVLVDDHDLFRGGLRDILQDQGIDVIGEASDGERGVRLVTELAPDVAVMDLNMPGMSGIEATRILATKAPASRVLVLTISSDDSDIMEAMLAGASGYLLKDATVEELAGGIRAAAAGESSIAPKIAARLLSRLREDHRAPPPTEEGRADLSERELEVLRLLAAGKGNAEIAGELFISPKTVKNHIASILVKLQIENRIQAAVYAVRAGIV